MDDHKRRSNGRLFDWSIVPTFSAEVIIPVDVFRAIDYTLSSSPKLMQTAYDRAVRGLRKRLLADLRIVPPPASQFYPLKWKTAKQERYVKWKLRTEGNLPYQRTGTLEQGWRVEHTPNGADGGLLTVSNATDYSEYVSGFYRQPFHEQIGWPDALYLIDEYSAEAEEVLVQVWFTIADPTAGVPG